MPGSRLKRSRPSDAGPDPVARALIERATEAYRAAIRRRTARGYHAVEAARRIFAEMSPDERRAVAKELVRLGFESHHGYSDNPARDRFVLFAGYCCYGCDLRLATPEQIRRSRNRMLGLPPNATVRDALDAIGREMLAAQEARESGLADRT